MSYFLGLPLPLPRLSDWSDGVRDDCGDVGLGLKLGVAGLDGNELWDDFGVSGTPVG